MVQFLNNIFNYILENAITKIVDTLESINSHLYLNN